mmetsp:Transcript_24155/g.53548  ORF Transcript_24155/g.53548 Transcript_24155/m.53548 type:complete len:240 (-) Transcript_24155:15-734(-)
MQVHIGHRTFTFRQRSQYPGLVCTERRGAMVRGKLEIHVHVAIEVHDTFALIDSCTLTRILAAVDDAPTSQIGNGHHCEADFGEEPHCLLAPMAGPLCEAQGNLGCDGLTRMLVCNNQHTLCGIGGSQSSDEEPSVLLGLVVHPSRRERHLAVSVSRKLLEALQNSHCAPVWLRQLPWQSHRTVQEGLLHQTRAAQWTLLVGGRRSCRETLLAPTRHQSCRHERCSKLPHYSTPEISST